MDLEITLCVNGETYQLPVDPRNALLYDLAKRIGAPTALKNIGMKEENLNEAISLVLEKAPDDNPRPVDEAGVRAILEDAYAGRRP
jgi:alcohol dehydrogenase class IV